MASGQEMMINTVLKMIGFDSVDAKRDLATAIHTVLSCGARLERIEQNQRRIMAALNIEVADDDNGTEQPKQIAAAR